MSVEPTPRRVPWRGLARLAGTLVLLGLLFAFVPLAEVWVALRSARPAPVFAALALHVVHIVLTAAQLRCFTSSVGLRASLRQLLEINLATALYGLVLPGAITGGAVRWVKLTRAGGRPAAALAAVALNRVFETIVFIALGIGFWLVERGPEAIAASAWLGAALALIAVGYGLAVGGPAAFVLRRLAGLAWMPGRVGSACGALAAAFDEARSAGPREHLLVGLLALARHALDLAGMVLLARALGIEASWTAIGWVRSVVRLAVLLPLSISGLGVRDAGFTLLLAPYGVAGAQAVALGFLMLGRGVFEALAGAVVELRGARTRDEG